jgi:hypothetical protein
MKGSPPDWLVLKMQNKTIDLFLQVKISFHLL